MTPEAQRIAIAEACGWRVAFPKHEIPHPETRRPGILLPYRWVNEITHKRLMELPDYLNDLNAMHEAEKILSGRQREIFADCLTALVVHHEWIKEYGGSVEFIYTVPGPDSYIGYIEHPADSMFDMLHATAAQRAEAFLRTLNLWPDDRR